MFDVNYSAPKKNIKRIKRKNNLDVSTKKILIISGAIFIIISMLTFIYIRKQNENYNNIKQDKSKYLVYTKYQKRSDNYTQYIPYINIKSDVIDLVNEDIDLFSEDFKDQKKCVMSYEYDINGIILSVVLKAIDYNTEYAPRTYFRSYNINLDTQEVISDDSLLDFFGINTDTVSNLIENKFRFFYSELVSQNYYAEDECDYECFLNYREVDDYTSDVSYYIEDGNLIGYKPFIVYSVYGEEEYFTDDSFKVTLVETEKN